MMIACQKANTLQQLLLQTRQAACFIWLLLSAAYTLCSMQHMLFALSEQLLLSTCQFKSKMHPGPHQSLYKKYV